MTPPFNRRETDQPDSDDTNSWTAWRLLVLDKLERFEKKFDAMDAKINKLQLETVTQKTKLTIFGTVGGFIACAVVQLAQYIFRRGPH